MFEKIFLKSKLFVAILVSITAVMITVFGIYLEQKFLMILPLYVSLGVMILNSQAMRIGALIGGLNSVLYAVVFFILGLYASAISALVLSFPFQIATFIIWSRRKDGATTKFRSLGARISIFVYSAIAIAYVPLLFLNLNAGGSFAYLDTAVSLLGFAVTVLTVFAFIEYTYLSLLQTVLTLILYSVMLKTEPTQATYLVYTAYSLICILRGTLNVHKIYHAQRAATEQTAVTK